MTNGETVAQFERKFAAFVGAKYAIAVCNGTATLHTALAALNVQSGVRVAVPPLTMASTSLAVLHAGAIPYYVDIDPDLWIMQPPPRGMVAIPVALYGLVPGREWYESTSNLVVLDAAQTLAPHSVGASFTSYSFQASKILPLGEGGMLVTNSEYLAITARRFASLGYALEADQPRIDPEALKSPTYRRHQTLGYNYRMSDIVAAEGIRKLQTVNAAIYDRAMAASLYADTVHGVPWLAPQTVPERWRHDYWTYAVAADTPERAAALADAIVAHGGERPYAAWLLSYQELPVQIRLDAQPRCPVAERLQPRLLQFQTNDLPQAVTNATALRAAIRDLGA
jgi:perosamine synthetase